VDTEPDEELQALMAAVGEFDGQSEVLGEPVEITEDDARETLMSMIKNKQTSVQKIGYQEPKRTKASIRTKAETE
jgi:hypothetical protein